MGVCCKIHLPAAARIIDVADVLAALCGAETIKMPLNDREGSWAAHAEARPIFSPYPGFPHWCNITWIVQTNSKPYTFSIMYHFEFGPSGSRGIMPQSTPFWLAVACGLVDFFGGHVDYKDCDDNDCDYSRDPQADIHAEDGEPWHNLQRRKLAVKPVTQDQIDAMKKHAAYN